MCGIFSKLTMEAAEKHQCFWSYTFPTNDLPDDVIIDIAIYADDTTNSLFEV